MKPSEFKKILKPLIKQTIREVLLEDGILSSVVSEVVRGLKDNLVVEASNKTEKQDLKRKEQEYEKQRQVRIKRLNESSKINVDIFEGTREIAESPENGALSGMSSADAGIDITNIEKLSNGKWKHLI